LFVIRELYSANSSFTGAGPALQHSASITATINYPEIPVKSNGMIIKSPSFVRISRCHTKDLAAAFLHLFSCTQHEGGGVALVTFRKLPPGKAKEG
jgi:hypothetical protein